MNRLEVWWRLRVRRWRAKQAMVLVRDLDLRMRCRRWPRDKRRKFWREFFRFPVVALDAYGEQLFGKGTE